MFNGLAAMVPLNTPHDLHQRLWHAILAPTWDAAREILHTEPDSSLEVHVLELFDIIRTIDQMEPELLFASVDASLDELSMHMPTQVVECLRASMTTYILPWGIMPRVLESDLTVDDANVSQLVVSYRWPLGPTRDHVHQLLMKIMQGMRGFRTAVESQHASEEERQIALETLLNRAHQALNEHGSHLLPGMADDLLFRVHTFTIAESNPNPNAAD